MSVQSEITRINGAKGSIRTAIEEKGVTVPSETKIDGMAALIKSIPSGGTTWELGQTMKLVDNVLDVNMVEEVSDDQQLPVSSKAVYAEIENIKQEKQDTIVVQYDQETETLDVQL